MKLKLIRGSQTVISKKELAKIELAETYLNDKYHVDAANKVKAEVSKIPSRTEVINFLTAKLNREITYLEIGVRVPDDNFNKIIATHKYSVDPGYENEENKVDFQVTSDEFFDGLKSGKILNKEILFDVIFIDGSHLADQVEKDINNALEFLKEDGFIVMHDCNPPTEFHASENYGYRLSPARNHWNGTTWKAFFKARKRTDIYSCCIDTDWGVGIISKRINLGKASETVNPFYEYYILEKNRKESLNLVDFENFKKLLGE